jgi:hypothetical protein
VLARGVSEDEVGVPEGFEVAMLQASLGPNVERSYGGVVVANFGIAGDDIDRELPNLMASVEVAVHEKTSPATLIDTDGPLRLSDLFGAEMPKVREVMSPVAWVLHHNALATIATKPERVQRFIECLQRISDLGREQTMYFIDAPTPLHVAFAMRIARLGVSLRQPDETRGPPLVQIEIKRPTGEVISMPAGLPYPLEKAHTGEPALVPMRSPRMRELVLDIADGGGETAMTALVTEVMTRELPLLLLVNADGSFGLRMFGEVTGIPVFGDATTLEWIATDSKLGREDYSIVAVAGQEVFAMAARERLGLAFATYRDRAQPIHVTLSSDAVFELAQFIQ